MSMHDDGMPAAGDEQLPFPPPCLGIPVNFCAIKLAYELMLACLVNLDF